MQMLIATSLQDIMKMLSGLATTATVGSYLLSYTLKVLKEKHCVVNYKI